MNAAAPVFRFAPSPNGGLHLGHALSACIGHDMARAVGGRFLVRIEDIDVGRTRPELVEAIFEDLAWLGLAWERPVLRQSEHFAVYREAAHKLEAAGLLYPCFATRSEIAAAAGAAPAATDPDGAPLYPGLHKGLPRGEIERRRAAGEPVALRLDMEKALAAADRLLDGTPLTFTEIDADGREKTVQALPARWGDAVIVRKDVPATYHLAAVIDDARQRVSHVTRGRDLFAATDLHRLLQVLLGLPAPVYHHHRLVTDEAGRKLAKSSGDTTLRSLREAGSSPAEVRRRIGLHQIAP
jgi:glutamyl-Q tRNA(Asp) synthetase